MAALLLLAGALAATAYARTGTGNDQLAFVGTPPSAVVVGDSVELTAQLSWTEESSPVVNPAGQTITFTAPDGSTCTGTLAAGGGNQDEATCSLTVEQAGTGSWSISYAGDSQLEPNSASSAVTVSAAPTYSSVSSAPDPSIPGQSVTLTDTVGTVADNYSQGAPPRSGVVNFTTGGGVAIPNCSNVTVSESLGTASCTTTEFAEAATSQVTATYLDVNGSGTNLDNYKSSSSTITQTIDQAVTTTAIQAPTGILIAGRTMEWDAVITPAPDGGSVSFTGNPTVASACASVPVGSGGTAICRVPITTAGTYAVTADYAGDQNFGASSSPSSSVSVQQDSTHVSFSATRLPPTTLDALTLTATVTAADPSTEVPLSTGTVKFEASFIPKGMCAKQPVSSSGLASCTIPSLFAQDDAFPSPANNHIADYAIYEPGSPVYDSVVSSTDAKSHFVLVPMSVKLASIKPAHPTAGERVAVSVRVSPIPEATRTVKGKRQVVRANLIEIHMAGGKNCSVDVSDRTGIATCDVTAPRSSGRFALRGEYIGVPGGFSPFSVWASPVYSATDEILVK